MIATTKTPIRAAILLQWPIKVDWTDATFLILYVQLIVRLIDLGTVILRTPVLSAVPTLVRHLMITVKVMV